MALTLVLLTVLGACKRTAPEDAAALKLRDGAKDTRRAYPAVYGIGTGDTWRDETGAAGELGQSICTVTAVSPTVAITTAHCVTPFPPQTPFWLVDADLHPVRGVDGNLILGEARYNPEYDPQRRSDTMRADLAFVRFRGAPFKRFYELAKAPPAAGARVTIVGYGYDEESPKAFYGRQFGTTVVTAVIDASTRRVDGQPFFDTDHTMIWVLLDLEENAKRVEKYASTVKGDSGGPMLEDGRIVGILRGGDGVSDLIDKKYVGDLYVNLAARINQDYIEFLRLEGWQF
jgi:V8-like Glu-specific endopeptidase